MHHTTCAAEVRTKDSVAEILAGPPMPASALAAEIRTTGCNSGEIATARVAEGSAKVMQASLVGLGALVGPLTVRFGKAWSQALVRLSPGILVCTATA